MNLAQAGKQSMNQAANYGFNDIKSHSSFLFNNALAVLFYDLDQAMIDMNIRYDVPSVKRVRAVLKQVYNRVRPIFFNAPWIKYKFNLMTQVDGYYTTDFLIHKIDSQIRYCDSAGIGYTEKYLHILAEELEDLYHTTTNILQSMSYFVRSNYQTKPDIDNAMQYYQGNVSKIALKQLKQIAGQDNKIDWSEFGEKRLERTQKYFGDEDGDEEMDVVIDQEKSISNQNQYQGGMQQ